jgi:hypothetical protein
MKLFIIICLLLPAFPALAIADARYCHEVIAIPRDKNKEIMRSAAAVKAFRDSHACPVTAKNNGPCPGWAINHIIPLSVGGCDTVENMQWLPDVIKSCSSATCVDRFERVIYDRNFGR